MGDDDLAAAVLVEICQQRVARPETDRDPDLRLKSSVTVADEDRDAVVELPSVRVHDVQLAVSVEIANAYSRRVAARRVADARQESPVALVHAHADTVTRGQDRSDEVGPTVAVKVAHRHVSWNIVAPVFDLDSILESAVGLAVKDERARPGLRRSLP